MVAKYQWNISLNDHEEHIKYHTKYMKTVFLAAKYLTKNIKITCKSSRRTTRLTAVMISERSEVHVKMRLQKYQTRREDEATKISDEKRRWGYKNISNNYQTRRWPLSIKNISNKISARQPREWLSDWVIVWVDKMLWKAA